MTCALESFDAQRPCIYCGELTETGLCQSCDEAFTRLKADHTAMLRKAQDELEVFIRQRTSQSCPYCKGTGKKQFGERS